MHIKTLGLLTATLLMTVTVHAWDPFKDLTGKRLDEHHQSLANSADKFRRNPGKYAVNRAQEIAEDICAQPVRAYVAFVRHPGSGLKPLPHNFISSAQPFYNVDLRNVRYSEGANVVNADALTDKGNIYVRGRINWNNPSNIYLMLHELEHVVQYSQRGGGRSRLQCEYALKSIGNGFQHDSIDMERAADRKANHVLRAWNQQRYSTQRRYTRPQAAYVNYRPMPLSNICRAGRYVAQVRPAPVGSQCGVTLSNGYGRGYTTLPGNITQR